MLKRLESVGLPTRLRDAEVERRVRVVLTAKGRAFKASAKKAPANMARAKRIPGCILAATQRDLAEAAALNRQVQTLRDQLVGQSPPPRFLPASTEAFIRKTAP